MQASGLVRLSWIIVALFALLLMAATAPYRYALLASNSSGYSSAAQDLGLSLPVLAFVITTLEVTTWLSFIVVAGVIAWHKSNHWFPLVIALTLTFLGIMPPLVDSLMNVHAGWQTLIPLLRALVYSGMLAMLCLFPDGRFVPSWSRWYLFAWFLFALIFWPNISTVLSEMSMIPDTPTLPNGLVLLVIGVLATIGLLFQFIRYRTYASVEQRQQTKWYLFGLLLLNTSSLVNGLSLSLFPALRDAAFGRFLYTLGIEILLMLAGIGFSVAIAFAILRYRLWDIDVLINRTLVYGTLTAGTMGVYVLMVGGFGALLPAHQGQTAAFILATGLVLVTIRPLHTQLQTAANRLVPLPAAPLHIKDGSQETELTINRSPFTIHHFLFRLVWMTLTAVSLLWFAANVPAFYRQVANAAPAAPGWYPVTTAGLDVLFVGLCTAVALLIFRRQPDNRMVWLTALVLVIWGAYNGLLIQTKGAILGDLNDNPGLVYYATELVTLAGYMGWMLFFYLFPNGRFVPRWTKITAVGWLLFSGSWYLWPTSPYTPDNWPDWLFGPVLLTLWGSFLVAQIVRYRRFSSPTERQQTKWVLYGIAIAVLTAPPIWLAFGTVYEIPLADWSRHLFVQTAGIVGIAAIPLTIGIAVLRHRLFDIDVLINRTLVYGGLTGITIGIYVLLVGGVGSLLQTQGSAAVAFVATGVVAVLFQPLRVRLQTAVNRLMYGQRDDPVGMLTHLAQRLETVDRPERILPTLVETIATALKLPHVSLWLPKDERRWEPTAVFGPQTDDLQMIPLLHQNREIARLFVAPRGPGERFSREDERLLTAIAQLSATTVQAAQLTFELQQSRRQLVTSREEERRRLRRDLHDGLGPVLASVALQADTARDLARTDPDETQAILNTIMNQAQTAVSDVRQLVYGLRPPALDELGLTGALRQSFQAYQHQLKIQIECGDLPPLPAAVEVAAYRIVQEAVNNVAKHARAVHCRVDIMVEAGLKLVIEDDGIGLGETAVSGVGLISMKERAAELDGTCAIERLSGRGTRVTAVLPLPSDINQ